jgi:hypothetical protein
MAKKTAAQNDIIQRVMHEEKAGTLKTPAGKIVTSRQQAIAIALHEAGASTQETPAKNRADKGQVLMKIQRGNAGG